MERGSAYKYLYQVYLTTKNDSYREALSVVLSALRPVSREQVEKVWRGERHRHYKSGIHAGNGVVCSECDMWNNRAAHFCPSCGRPMTDEAVRMVMERLEALKDAGD